MNEKERLKRSAELASGYGPGDGVERPEWCSDVEIGDRVRVDSDAVTEPFTATVIGYSHRDGYRGQPVISSGDVPKENVYGQVVLRECDVDTDGDSPFMFEIGDGGDAP